MSSPRTRHTHTVWRETLAVLAVLAWLWVGSFWVITGPLMWLLRLFGPVEWNPDGMNA